MVIENYIDWLRPRVHGLDDPRYPSLVGVLIVNTNLPVPSAWSRRRIEVEANSRAAGGRRDHVSGAAAARSRNRTMRGRQECSAGAYNEHFIVDSWSTDARLNPIASYHWAAPAWKLVPALGIPGIHGPARLWTVPLGLQAL